MWVFRPRLSCDALQSQELIQPRAGKAKADGTTLAHTRTASLARQSGGRHRSRSRRTRVVADPIPRSGGALWASRTSHILDTSETARDHRPLMWLQRRRAAAALVTIALAMGGSAAASAMHGAPIAIAAASDLQSVMPGVVERFEKATGRQVRVSYG